ncbi:MAG: sensor histidine kinase [Ruminiclostridium sp.]
MKRIKPYLIVFPLLLVLSFALIFIMLHNDSHAIPSLPLKVRFEGEYKLNDGDWQEIIEGESIPFGEGEMRLKGHFRLLIPYDEASIEPAPKGISLIACFSHIGGQISINDQPVHLFDMENKQFGGSSCGEEWIVFDNPAEETDTVEILLINPHKYGNKNAADVFLDSIYTYSGAAFDEIMLSEGDTERTAGIVIMVVSFIVLGVAIFSTVLKVPHSRLLWIFGFMLLTAGGFSVLDSPNFCLSESTPAFITTAKSLCAILYPAFMFCLTESRLSNRLKKIGGAVSAANAALSAAALIIAITGGKLIYDLNYYLLITEAVSGLILAVLCAASFKSQSLRQRVLTAVCIVALLALEADIFAVIFGSWDNVFLSKIVFAAVFVAALVYSLKLIPMTIKSSIHEKELQLELQEKQVAVMLSQIQPHFLYNALTAICDLCGTEPKKAREALVDFSVYLRENMDSINSSSPVSFSRELSHIKTYLKLEKLRFEEKINVVYDIETDNFEIPPLTVQPLVENAVKHGICPKENGGTITIKSEEKDGIITITVADDGVGFDVKNPVTDSGNRSHIGLENVRKRVENYHSGKLTVESEKAKGTTVTISFHK